MTERYQSLVDPAACSLRFLQPWLVKSRGEGGLPCTIAVIPNPRFGQLRQGNAMPPIKQDMQVRQTVTTIEGMEARLVELLKIEMKMMWEEMNSQMAR